MVVVSRCAIGVWGHHQTQCGCPCHIVVYPDQTMSMSPSTLFHFLTISYLLSLSGSWLAQGMGVQ